MTAVAFVGSAAIVMGLALLRLAPRPTRHAAPFARSASRQPPPWFAEVVAASGPVDVARAWGVLLVVGPALLVALALVAGPVATVLCALAVAGAPRAARPLIERRRADQRDAQLPAALERLASSLRGGTAPTAALVSVAATTPAPLGVELRVPAAEIQHGAPMAAAIDRWAGAPGASPAVQLAAAALGLGVDAGGQVARSMDRVAATLRERRELQAEVRALATQARASAAVLALAPLAFTALVSTIEPGMVRFLVATPLGASCLVSGLGLEVAGAVWMARITSSAA